jgi:chromosome partitioning protein
MSQTDSFRWVADVLREAQRAAIEVENAPDKRKRLRSFSLQEVAALLGVTQRELRGLSGSVGPKLPVAGRIGFELVQTLRGSLCPDRGQLVEHRGRARNGGDKLATVVFTNFKGGSAKTTSSVHFAQYLALAGYRVLLVDLDSQGSATSQFGVDPASEVGSANSFAAWTLAQETGVSIRPETLCAQTYWPTIDLVAAGAILAEAEESLSRRSRSAEPQEPLYFDALGTFLAEVRDRYDVAVVDTRPDVNMLMTTALHAATGLIIPSRATMMDLASTGEFFAHLAGYIADFRKSFGGGLELAFTRILVTAYDPTDRSQEALLALLRERFGDMVLPGEFLHSRVVGTAGFAKETIYEYEPTTDRAAYNRVLASVNAVNRAVEEELLAVCSKLSLEGRVRP